MSTSPRIYVACLASYNAGRLHGAWIDLDGKDEDQVNEEIAAILKTSPTEGAEEWAIHDHEGLGKIGEHTPIADIVRIVELSAEHGEVFSKLVENFSGDVEQAATLMEDGYRCAWDSLEDYARDYIDQMGILGKADDIVSRYFDYEAFARDLELGGDVFTIETSDGMVHVFDGTI